mgnify:CR=1 FL=1
MRFHATGNIANEESAFRILIDHPEILIFSFAFEEGKISYGSGRFGNDPHLSFWQESLPLVLEYIANITRSSTEVDIFVVRHCLRHECSLPITFVDADVAAGIVRANIELQPLRLRHHLRGRPNVPRVRHRRLDRRGEIAEVLRFEG